MNPRDLRGLLALVREHGWAVSHDGAGNLNFTRAVPGARLPGSLVDAVAPFRPALAAPCEVCRAAVYRPCEVGAVCDLADCPYFTTLTPRQCDALRDQRATRRRVEQAERDSARPRPDGRAPGG